MVANLNNSLTKHRRRIDELECTQKNTFCHVEQLSVTQKEFLNNFTMTRQSFDNFFAKIQTTENDIIKLQDLIENISKRINKVAKIQSHSENKVKNIISNFGTESLQIAKKVADFKVSTTFYFLRSKSN